MAKLTAQVLQALHFQSQACTASSRGCRHHLLLSKVVYAFGKMRWHNKKTQFKSTHGINNIPHIPKKYIYICTYNIFIYI